MHALDSYLGQVAAALLATPSAALGDIADALWKTYQRDGTVIICGNGGSAATASHFACDLVKWTATPNMRRVRALALTDNIPVIMAWSNDQGFEDVFVEQLRSSYRPGDLLFAISGSGNSPNVLRAVAWANAIGAPTVGLAGFDGGQLVSMVRHSLRVDNHVMPQVEDVHMAICHGLAVQLGTQISDMRAGG